MLNKFYFKFKNIGKIIAKFTFILKNFKLIFINIKELKQNTKLFRFENNSINGKKSLIFAYDDYSLYNIKLLGFVSQSLFLKGFDPIVIFKDRSMFLGKLYFRFFGLNKYIYIDDEYLCEKEFDQCKIYINQKLNSEFSIQNIKEWKFEECWIGPQVISTLSRMNYEGNLDFKNEKIIFEMKKILKDITINIIKIKKLYKNLNADNAITIEANYSSYGPLVDLAIYKNIDVIQLTQPWKDDALIIRRLNKITRREHPSSVSFKTLKQISMNKWTKYNENLLNQIFKERYGEKWFLQSRNQKNKVEFSKKDILEKYSLDSNKKIAVIFSHILWDANLFYGDDLFNDYGHWFIETIKAACANENINWLIKIHPANIWKRNYENISKTYAEMILINREIGTLPKHVKIISADDNISTYSLFKYIDVGITVRGTTGMELPCFGKNIVTGGTGRYSGLGFTNDSETQEEYLKKLSNIHTLSDLSDDKIQLAKWHALIAFEYRPWSMTSVKSIFNYSKLGNSIFDHDLLFEPIISEVKSLINLNDIVNLSHWISGNNVDYIDENKVDINFT